MDTYCSTLPRPGPTAVTSSVLLNTLGDWAKTGGSKSMEGYRRAFLIVNEEAARPERFELPTLWFEARCSIQLSYGRVTSL